MAAISEADWTGYLFDESKVFGQQVADATLRDIAAMLARFEPPARVEMRHAEIGDDRQVIVLEAGAARQYAPFVFASKPSKPVGGDVPAAHAMRHAMEPPTGGEVTS